jgi:hypothetical protein
LMRLSGGPKLSDAPAKTNPRGFRAGFLVLTIGLLLIGLVRPVYSQDAVRVVVGGLQTGAFPAIEFSLEAYDGQGNFVSDLTSSDLVLIEDGQPVSGAVLDMEEPGLQFSVAINPGPQLATSIGGKSQIDLLRSALVDWAHRQPGISGSDFSFATNTGLQVIRSQDTEQWSQAFADFQPNLTQGELNLFSLTTVLDLASDQGIDPRMKRAVLFITPPVSTGLASSLEDLTSRAQQVGVRVFVWVTVTDLNSSSPPDTSALQSLAQNTGGRFTLVAGEETIPDLESWLAPLRYIYQVKFLSKVQQSGQHRVGVQLRRDELSTPEQVLSYSIELKPPNPIFLSPPSRVERAWMEVEGSSESVLSPAVLPLQIVVEFSDGYTRPLAATRLYLDGVLLAENTAPPFEQFNWDLTGLTTSGAHSLRVEAVDSLGVVGSSIESPVEVIVELRPAEGLLQRISRRGLIAVGAVLVAGVVLAMVLIGENRFRGRRKRGDKRRMEDPVTQPVPIPQDNANTSRSKRATTEPGSWPRVSATQPIPARMIRVTEDEHPVPGSLIPLNRSEITFGSDARQAVILVEDSSVNKLHARLLRSDDGGFILMDEGSVAGTWVNYTPITSEGVRLKHDDLIHLGRVIFRFELTNPPAPVLPSVEMMDEGA